MKLGRKPRIFKPTLHWSTLRHMSQAPAAASPTPAGYSWLANMPANFGMMGNDTLGDCVCACMYHALQVWTFNANPPELTEPASMAIKAYEEYCGYRPSDPNSDQGCVEQTTFDDWFSKGIPLADGTVDKLLVPPIEIDVRNIPDICDAVYQCGAVGIGFNVPAFIMAGAPPPVWMREPNADNTIVGGHCTAVVGFHKHHRTFDMISWGAPYKMKWGFWQDEVDEAYALVSKRWIEKTGLTPLGLTMAQLEALAQGI